MMLNWFRKQPTEDPQTPSTSNDLALANPCGLESAEIALLTEAFSRINLRREGLTDYVVTYIVDGGNDSVLTSLTEEKDLGNLLKLNGCGWCGGWGDVSQSEVTTFIHKSKIEHPEFWLRFAFALNAAAAPCGDHLKMQEVLESAGWLEVLLRQSGVSNRRESIFSAEFLENLLALGGEDRSELVKMVLSCGRIDAPTGIPGLAESFARNRETVEAYILTSDNEKRVDAIEVMSLIGVNPEDHVDLLAQLLTSPSKRVRSQTGRYVQGQAATFKPIMLKMATTGDNTVREAAVTFLRNYLLDDETRAFCKRQMESEAASRVRKALEDTLSNVPPSEKSAPIPLPELQGLPEINARHSPPETLVDALELIAKIHRDSGALYKERQEEMKANALIHSPPSKADINNVVEQFPDLTCDASHSLFQYAAYVDYEAVREVIAALIANLDYEMVDHLKVLIVLGLLKQRQGIRDVTQLEIVNETEDLIIDFIQARDPKFDLRNLGHYMDALGLDPDTIGWTYLTSHGTHFHWEPNLVWPYFWEYPHIFEEVFQLRTLSPRVNPIELPELRRQAFIVLADFPQIPAPLTKILWKTALGSNAVERSLAQRVLEKDPDRESRIIDSLQGGKQTQREQAAIWLGKTGDQDAIPELQKALKKERHDLARAALMEALETLGVDQESIISMKDMLALSRRMLKRPFPPFIDAYLSGLSTLHWQHSGNQIADSVVRWFVVQAAKKKSPAPDPLQLRHASFLREEDRQTMAYSLLDTWMSRGGDIHEKGILGLVGAANAPGTAAPVRAYIEKNYSSKFPQCKALIQMLGWVDQCDANQLLLRTLSTFPTAGIRNEARKSIEAMAARNEWTNEQILDHTIPDLGFNAQGELKVSYGERTFTALLNKDFELVIKSAKGRVFKHMPKLQEDEDPKVVKAAKATFFKARKETRNLIDQETQRIYEGFCTHRSWSADHLLNVLIHHPLVSGLYNRLVWIKDQKDCFRITPDGKTVNLEGEEISLTDAKSIYIAHSSQLEKERITGWLDCLEKEGFPPLFPQFEHSLRLYPPNKRNLRVISEFRGQVIPICDLHKKALSLGFQQPEHEKGQWFSTYEKHFPGLNIVFEIEFSGAKSILSGSTVALKAARFYQRESELGAPRRRRPGKLPPILFSECYGSLHALAMSGSGFKENWQELVKTS